MEKFIGRTVAFIPVRGGSKSIPYKNIKLINGRPLVFWVLDATVNCMEIDKVVVSTDSEKIKNIIEKYNSDKIMVIDRSEMVSSDTATTESAMLEFAANYDFENIVMVQATSPLLKNTDITKGIKKYFEKDIDSVLSVVRQKKFIWEEHGGYSLPVNYNPKDRPRRQDFDGFLVENGAFYITSKKALLATKCRISGRISTIELSDDTYYEIDEPLDWIIVEDLLNKKEKYYAYDKNIDKIKCVLTDNDGVLTDGGMYYSEKGDELKKFNTKDGMGFSLLKEKHIITGIITGEDNDLVKRRAEKVKADILFTGIKDKVKVLNEICEQYNLKYDEIAYIGDDINDMEIIRTVGLGCTVCDGMECVKKVSKIVTKSKGGEGAFREVAEMILNAKKV